MKHLRQFSAAAVLTLTLTLSTFAGQMDTGFVQLSAQSTAKGQMDTGLATTAPGQMDTGRTVISTESTLNILSHLLRSMILFF